MPDTNTFEVRDLRTKEKFVVDDEYLNGWAKYCRIYATGVYVVLCRHANGETQSCFPSIPLMAEKLGISQRQVIRAIAILEQFNIIAKEKGREHNANIYYLIDKKHWLSSDSQSLVTNSHDSSDSQSPLLVTHSHPKVSKRRIQKKDTYTSDFQSFYAAYPKHEARKKAFDAWLKIDFLALEVDTIPSAVERQKAHKEHLNRTGQFCPGWPMPATWLNDRRWEDEIPEVKPQTKEVVL